MKLGRGQRWFILILSILVWLVWWGDVTDFYVEADAILPFLVLAAGIWVFKWAPRKDQETGD